MSFSLSSSSLTLLSSMTDSPRDTSNLSIIESVTNNNYYNSNNHNRYNHGIPTDAYYVELAKNLTRLNEIPCLHSEIDLIYQAANELFGKEAWEEAVELNNAKLILLLLQAQWSIFCANGLIDRLKIGTFDSFDGFLKNGNAMKFHGASTDNFHSNQSINFERQDKQDIRTALKYSQTVIPDAVAQCEKTLPLVYPPTNITSTTNSTPNYNVCLPSSSSSASSSSSSSISNSNTLSPAHHLHLHCHGTTRKIHPGQYNKAIHNQMGHAKANALINSTNSKVLRSLLAYRPPNSKNKEYAQSYDEFSKLLDVNHAQRTAFCCFDNCPHYIVGFGDQRTARRHIWNHLADLVDGNDGSPVALGSGIPGLNRRGGGTDNVNVNGGDIGKNTIDNCVLATFYYQCKYTCKHCRKRVYFESKEAHERLCCLKHKELYAAVGVLLLSDEIYLSTFAAKNNNQNIMFGFDGVNHHNYGESSRKSITGGPLIHEKSSYKGFTANNQGFLVSPPPLASQGVTDCPENCESCAKKGILNGKKNILKKKDIKNEENDDDGDVLMKSFEPHDETEDEEVEGDIDTDGINLGNNAQGVNSMGIQDDKDTDNETLDGNDFDENATADEANGDSSSTDNDNDNDEDNKDNHNKFHYSGLEMSSTDYSNNIPDAANYFSNINSLNDPNVLSYPSITESTATAATSMEFSSTDTSVEECIFTNVSNFVYGGNDSNNNSNNTTNQIPNFDIIIRDFGPGSNGNNSYPSNNLGHSKSKIASYKADRYNSTNSNNIISSNSNNNIGSFRGSKYNNNLLLELTNAGFFTDAAVEEAGKAATTVATSIAPALNAATRTEARAEAVPGILDVDIDMLSRYVDLDSDTNDNDIEEEEKGSEDIIQAIIEVIGMANKGNKDAVTATTGTETMAISARGNCGCNYPVVNKCDVRGNNCDISRLEHLFSLTSSRISKSPILSSPPTSRGESSAGSEAYSLALTSPEVEAFGKKAH